MHLLPSDIARLVLGYLKENGLKKTFVAFLQESPDLAEYWRVLNAGQMPTTTVMGHTLKNILEDYAALTLRVKDLNAKLAELPVAASSDDNPWACHILQSDIDAVVESHRQAELDRKQKAAKQRAKRRNDPRGKRSLIAAGSSSSTVNSRDKTPSQSSLVAVDGRQAARKSNEHDDLDEEFEFDSLDRLLADTKLHEKLAQSINKALKRDQIPTTDQLMATSSSSKKNDSNQNEHAAGYSTQGKEMPQKDTSAVVDDIISMAENEPGLEQLLSLFQFPHTESEHKTAPLYLPDVGSKKMHHPQFDSAVPSTSSHPTSPAPNKERNHTGNNGDVNISQQNSTKSHAEYSTYDSVDPLQTADTPEHLSKVQPSTYSNPQDKTQAMSSKDCSVSIVNSAHAKEASSEEVIGELKQSTLNTPLSNISSQKEPSSSVKLLNLARHPRRVKRCPKKLFKGGETSISASEHGTHLNPERENVMDVAALNGPLKKHDLKTDATTNSLGSETHGENSRLPQSLSNNSSVKQNDDTVRHSTYINHSSNSSEKPFLAVEKINNSIVNDKGSLENNVTVSSAQSLHTKDIHTPSTSSSLLVLESKLSPSDQHVSKHWPVKSLSKMVESGTIYAMDAAPLKAKSPPRSGMEENSLSVFTLINKCTAEIIGEGYTPSRVKTPDDIRDMRMGVKEENGEEKQSKCAEVYPKESVPEIQDTDLSFKVELQENKQENCFGSLNEIPASPSHKGAPASPLSEVPEDKGHDGYDSDSSFDNKVSTPNAVYVKPIKLDRPPSTREKNYKMLDTCLQDILGKMEASSGETPDNDCEDKQRERSHLQESAQELKEFNDSINADVNMNDHCQEESMEANPAKVPFTPDKDSQCYDHKILNKISGCDVHGIEGLFNCPATISTPFVMKTIVNTDNSPRKLVEPCMKHNESASLPATFLSSEREGHHHKPHDFRSQLSPSLSKFHPKSKENFSPIMSMTQASRKVIACNITHSPFMPSHLKKKAPSRRITPMEVSFSTPSPLGMLSPSSPAEFVIDLAQSPRVPGTPVREFRSNLAEVQVQSLDDVIVIEDSQNELKSSPNKYVDADNSNVSFKEREIIQEVEASMEKRNGAVTSPLIKDKEPASPTRDSTTDVSLPPSPSQRKPRRIVPTLLSRTVSKVGGDSLFSSSSCSQNTTIFNTDESKIVSSSSDPTTLHSEAEAFRQLKNLIFHSYTKPQPNQEITSSNGSKGSYPSTSSRKCGCESRDACPHATRLRHSSSTPMRKCGCVSRDVCTHVKGKERKLGRKRSSSFSKSEVNNSLVLSNSNIPNVAEKSGFEHESGELDPEVNCDTKDNEKHKDKVDCVAGFTECSLSNAAFVVVGTVQTGVDDTKMVDKLDEAGVKSGNYDVTEKGGDVEKETYENITNIPVVPESSLKETVIDEHQLETGHCSVIEQVDDFETPVVQNEVGKDKNESDCERKRDDDNKNKDNNVEIDNKGNSNQSSKESSESVRRGAEFDHHEPISFTAPYFPELSNAFDFFKLNKSDTVNINSEGNHPLNSTTATKSNSNPVLISPMPGTLHGDNQPTNQEDDPLNISSCLISQAMEQCGIPFEPGEQTIMELSHFVGMNDDGMENQAPVNPNAQGDNMPMTGMPNSQEAQAVKLQSNKRPSVSARASKRKEAAKPSQLLELRPNTQPKAAQPQIILPTQSNNASPAPMMPGMVAYFSRPNLPPVPFTILADGTVIVLSDTNIAAPKPPTSNPPKPPNQLPTILPRTSTHNLVPNTSSTFTPPAPVQQSRYQTRSATQYKLAQQRVSTQNISNHTPLPTQSIHMNQMPVSAEPIYQHTPPTMLPTEAPLLPPPILNPTQAVPLKENINKSVTFNSHSKSSQSDSSKRSDGEIAKKEKAKKVLSSSHSKDKEKKKDLESSSTSKEKRQSSSNSGSLQKVAMRRKMDDISSSPKKASVSTYFQKPNKFVKRRLSLTASKKSAEATNGSNKNCHGEVFAQESVEEKEDSHRDGQELHDMPVYDIETETQRACDLIACINGESPVKTNHSEEGHSYPQSETAFSPLKDSLLKTTEKKTVARPETCLDMPVLVENEYVSPEVESARVEKEKMLTSLHLKKKECHVSFSSDAKNITDSEKLNTIPVKDNLNLKSEQKSSSHPTDKTTKESESSSHESELSGNSLQGQLHSTPVDENFFDNLESMSEMENNGKEVLGVNIENMAIEAENRVVDAKTREDFKQEEKRKSTLPLTHQKKNGSLPPTPQKKNCSLPSTPQKKNGSLPPTPQKKNGSLPPTPQKKNCSLPSTPQKKNGSLPPTPQKKNGSLPSTPQKKNDSLLTSPQKKVKSSHGISPRKSFSDILKGVSLKFTTTRSSPKKKKRPDSSDDEDYDNPYVNYSGGMSRAWLISDSSTSSSDSDSDSSIEEIVQSYVSYAKIVKDKSTSIRTFDDGDIIRNIADSSISLEGIIRSNRKEKRNPREKAGHKSKSQHSECDSENLGSPKGDKKQLVCRKESLQEGQNRNKIGAFLGNDDNKETLELEKSNASVLDSKNRKRKADVTSSPNKHKRQRKERFSDGEEENFRSLHLSESEGEEIKTRVAYRTKKSRNLFNDIADFAKKDDKHDQNVKEKSGLDLLSSVALSNQNPDICNTSCNLSDTVIDHKSSHPKNDANSSELFSESKSSDSKSLSLNKSSNSDTLTNIANSSDSHDSATRSKKLQLNNSPMVSDSPQLESTQSSSQLSSQRENSHHSVPPSIPSSPDVIPSSLDMNSLSAATATPVCGPAASQSHSDCTPNATPPSSQQSSHGISSTKGSISKKRINKLLGKLYKAPPKAPT